MRLVYILLFILLISNVYAAPSAEEAIIEFSDADASDTPDYHFSDTYYSDGCYITSSVLDDVDNINSIWLVDDESSECTNGGVPIDCNICGWQMCEWEEGSGGGGGGGPGPDPYCTNGCMNWPACDCEEDPDSDDGLGNDDVDDDVADTDSVTGEIISGTIIDIDLPSITIFRDWLTGATTVDDVFTGGGSWGPVNACTVSYSNYPTECSTYLKVNYWHYTLENNACGDCIIDGSEACDKGSSTTRITSDDGTYTYLCSSCQISDKQEISCNDGDDNDGDGDVDCDDSDCDDDSDCMAECNGILLCSDQDYYTENQVESHTGSYDCSSGPMCVTGTLDCQGGTIDGPIYVAGGGESMTSCTVGGAEIHTSGFEVYDSVSELTDDSAWYLLGDNIIFEGSVGINSGNGIRIYGEDVTLTSSSFTGNTFGLYVDSAANGLSVSGVTSHENDYGYYIESDGLYIDNSVATSNNVGIYLVGSSGTVNIQSSSNNYGLQYSVVYADQEDQLILTGSHLCYNDEEDYTCLGSSSMDLDIYADPIYMDTYSVCEELEAVSQHVDPDDAQEVYCENGCTNWPACDDCDGDDDDGIIDIEVDTTVQPEIFDDTNVKIDQMIEDGELHAEVEQIMIEEGLRQVQIEMEATQAMIDYILEIIEGQILWIPVDEEEENFVTDIINDILAGISTDYIIENYGIEEESLGTLIAGIEGYNSAYEEFLYENYIEGSSNELGYAYSNSLNEITNYMGDGDSHMFTAHGASASELMNDINVNSQQDVANSYGLVEMYNTQGYTNQQNWVGFAAATDLTFPDNSDVRTCGYGECDEGYVWYNGDCFEGVIPDDVNYGSQQVWEQYSTGNYYAGLLLYLHDYIYHADNCGDDIEIYPGLIDSHKICVPVFSE